MKLKKITFSLPILTLVATSLMTITSCSSNYISEEQKKMNNITLSDVLKKINMVKSDPTKFPSDALKNSKINCELYNQELNGLSELIIKTNVNYNNILGEIYYNISIMKSALDQSIKIKSKQFDNEIIKGYRKESKNDVFNSISGDDIANALNIYSNHEVLSNQIVPPTVPLQNIKINNLENIKVNINDWKAQPNDGTITMNFIISYNDKTKIIPNTVSGYKVVLDNSNESDGSLISNNNGNITIQNKVTEIASSTFLSGKFNSDVIKSISFANNSHLKIIGDQSFQGVSALDTPLVFPNSVISIGKLAFATLNNISNVKTFDLSNLRDIGDYAFASLNLSSLKIPQFITSIGSGAFLNSTFYDSITKKYELSFDGIDPLNDKNHKLDLGVGAFEKYLVSNIQDKYWKYWAAHSTQADAFAFPKNNK